MPARSSLLRDNLSLLCCSSLFLLLALPEARAEDFFGQTLMKPGTETFQINLGGIVNSFNTKVEVNGETTRGTDINLENAGLPHTKSSFDAGLTWRFFPRHRVDVEWFQASRSGSHTYTDSITIGDNTYPLGATVNAESKYRFLLADYRYSFMKTDELELAGAVGFYGAHFDFNFNATGTQGGNVRTTSTSASTPVPLPVIGVTADWYVNQRFKVFGFVEGLKAKINDVDGRVLVTGAAAEYMFTRSLGAGARYMYTDIHADVTKTNFNGSFDWKMNSVALYAKMLF